MFKKNKKKILFIAILLIIIISIVSIIILLNQNDSNEIKNEQFEKEYEELNGVLTSDGNKYPEVNIPSANRIKYSNIDELLNIFNNYGDAVVYFGGPECIYCRHVVQILIDTAINTEIDEILYLNIKNTENKYQELLDNLNEEFITDIGFGDEIYTPLVIFIVDGEIVSYNKGTLFSHTGPYNNMDASQIEGLSEIYRLGIETVISSKNLKKIKQ